MQGVRAAGLAPSPLHYARTHRSRFLEELCRFLRFPSVSGDPRQAEGVRRCAAWLARHLRTLGLDRVRVVDTGGHPFVLAEWLGAPGRPTVLIYGHYDVQPPGSLELWRSPPFEPRIRGEDLFARGASDDKGQLFTHVKALDSYLRARGSLPVNVRCLFDGEEEIGSPSLILLLGDRPRDIRADVCVVSDTRFLGPERPAITYALRGLLACELKVRGPARELHAGHFGGAVRSPVETLCEVVVGLHDRTGRIAVPRFYDPVRELDRAERAALARAAPHHDQILRATGAREGEGERGYSLNERTTIRPALTVTGFVQRAATGGATIPATAIARLDVRLVPDQEPGEVERLLRAQVRRAAPRVRASLRATVRVPPVVVNPRHPAMRAAARAYLRGFGRAPAFVRSGGTIPMVSALHRTVGAPVVMMGFGLPDDGMHGPNEKLHLPNFFRGIETSIAFLEEVARC